MMRRWIPCLILLAAACRCNDGSAAPSEHQITLGKTALKAALYRTGLDRARLPDAVKILRQGEAAVAAYSRERHIHLYGDRYTAIFDVAFLDGSRKVVETAQLRPTRDEGLTAATPAQYAVLLRRGTLEANDIRKGSEIGFSESMLKEPPEPLPVLDIAGKKVCVELARNELERQRGLMHRPYMLWDSGMLFVYDGPEEPHSFWMRNTLISLDIAFLRRDGTVVNVVETPRWKDPELGDEGRSRSEGPCQYVLEVNYGWFRRHGLLDEAGKVKPGLRVEIPASCRAKP